jgi:pentatricopeptide repeat protein
MIRNFTVAKHLPLILLVSWSTCSARSPWSQPVGRMSSDRDADLIDALVRENRFDDAEQICQSLLRGIDAESDSAAKWTIRRSQALTARQMMSERFEEPDVQAARRPTADFLAY